METKKLKRISDISFYITIVFAVAVIGKNYYDRMNLPPGVCPVENNSWLMYTAIALLVVTFITTTVIDRKFKKEQITNKEKDSENTEHKDV